MKINTKLKSKKNPKHCGYMFRKLGMAQGALLVATHGVAFSSDRGRTALGNAVEDLDKVGEEWNGSEVRAAQKKIEAIDKTLRKAGKMPISKVIEIRNKIENIAREIDRISPPGCRD